MTDLKNFKINLTSEEQDILHGSQGPTLQKVMETVVRYGEALGAERLVDIEGAGHFVLSWSSPGIAPPLELLDELVQAGLQTKYPFTLDPYAPLDFENLGLRVDQEQTLDDMYRDQEQYDTRMRQLGLRDSDAYSCNPYLPEVGNVPKRGAILAWSESACAIFANSALGARTNRNSAIIDLLSNIVGKTPLFGLLTDEGRNATWKIEVRTETLPNPQLLGAAIGLKVLAGIPYIVGLDHFLGSGLNDEILDYLHEMGAACATYSAVSLFHVENVTPEAVDQGTGLLIDDHETCIIDDLELQNLLNTYPLLWTEQTMKPEKCLIGCPHLSFRQLQWWAEAILSSLESCDQSKLAVETILFSAPQVLEKFKADTDTYERLLRVGVKFSASCAETLYEGDVVAGEAIVTNSNKLRAYTSARFFPDQDLVMILVDGEIKHER